MMAAYSITRSKPVALQVQEMLRERICQGMYPADQRMPSEERLAEELQVSRATIRTALASLAAEGYIRRRHGDGTYVSPHAFEINLRLGKVWDIELQIQKSGRQSNRQILEHLERPATPEEMELLGLAPGERVLSITLLFCADNQPVMLITNRTSILGLSANIPPDAVSLPWLEFLKQYHQKKLGTGQIHFQACLADPETAARLKILPGGPLLVMNVVLLDDQGHPLSLGKEVYVGQEGFKMISSLVG
jgi:GntR family transcriptional regulator